MKTSLTMAIIFCELLNVAFAQTWTQFKAPNTNWISVASSADGHIIFACTEATRSLTATNNGTIFVSTNSGTMWTQTSAPGTNSWLPIAVSADGNTVIAGNRNTSGSPFFLSTDLGMTWTPTVAPIGYVASSVATSANGTILMGSTYNLVYISTNSGTTWASNNFAVSPLSVASTPGGNKLFVLGSQVLWTSTDYGSTWTSNSAPNPFGEWLSFTVSTDGTKLAATGVSVIFPNNLFISTNSGSSWFEASFPISPFSFLPVAISADGTKLWGGGSNGQIYVLTNWSATWATTDAPIRDWNSIALSADASELVATSSSNSISGEIWILQSTPSPKLNLTSLVNNFDLLSWLIPSTNFALQQNLDLSTTNWMTMTNTPTLNLTNLQDEIILSSSNSSSFFRLISQ